MKKILSVFAIVALTTLASCGSGETTETVVDETVVTDTTSVVVDTTNTSAQDTVK